MFNLFADIRFRSKPESADLEFVRRLYSLSPATGRLMKDRTFGVTAFELHSICVFLGLIFIPIFSELVRSAPRKKVSEFLACSTISCVFVVIVRVPDWRFSIGTDTTSVRDLE